ncbi:hypothetical protein PHYBLDRAFT_188164 [Phycomyces blakesleeanus NRRL 1555(-)]|uniref:PUM-HD domain-containing protein n=1 Tax=Phycomyces blakesleeanus (strain ATCC 8743b / DSM 1359 / FGSC 10004 / NBRC 33097 / NRRL 1555) TaxID=763407 RepID=A0A162TU62_PHYB8|nr:hypothetical protein PHYBLDRAFT_188164 [Phycomyces blakesleeanus NRRL 1555(-)]OAD69853.1 hypothetical protein PHYBLDRAFT_188164 [Phycomyces blakesleeanus NRRL 1555(-)]|eukprot:XP_018287893.1 hypothetical protein PHYBLDRAFT_188164 [Phycomyces blakesleeanus NRRL 1555(-)]
MELPWASDTTGAGTHNFIPNTTTLPPSTRITVEDTSTSAAGLSYPTTTGHRMLRRPRADTMPSQASFPYPPMFGGLAPVQATRHRSGSVNLPSDQSEDLSEAFYGASYTALPLDDDPDADITIASTMASLGLNDEDIDPQEEARQTFVTPPGLSVPHNSFFNGTATGGTNGASVGSGVGAAQAAGGVGGVGVGVSGNNTTSDSPMTRNRAYTVATRAPLDRPDLNRIAPGLNFSPFSPQTLNAVQTRPRATSMGMADGAMMNSFSPFDINSFQQRIPTRFQPPQVVVSAEPEQPEHTLRNTYSSGNLFDMNRDMTFAPVNNSRRPFRRVPSHEQLDRLPESDNTNDFYSGSDSFTVWSGFDTSSPGTQIPSRALWLGNVNPSLSVPDLIQLFSCYGTVESARILSDKECAFVNFSTVESAVAAKADLETRLGNKVAGTPVRVGFGKADVSIAMALTNEAGPNAQGPTRALWVGNIPANINPALLRALFQTYGPIESVRVLSHKNCGFVNFEHQEDAVKARKSLQNKEVLGPGTGPVRIGFAKVPATPSEDSQGDESAPSTNPGSNSPSTSNTDVNSSTVNASSATTTNSNNGTPDNYQATQWATAMMMTSMMMRASGQPQPLSSSQPTSLYTAIAAERCFIMQQLGCVGSLDEEEERAPVTYSSAIPILPEIGADRHLEPLRLREMRKGLDSGQGLSEVESMVDECMDEIVELCSDYVGNTVIQKLFEYCTEDTKERMLSAIGPYLASIGVHKNGTWAAQKIIDYAHTEGQMQLVCTHVAPYVPLLLLDQFGNYVVQCSLRMGPEKNQYIFDAIVDKCWEIGQGRFGARAVRAILENPVVTKKQQVYCAAAIVQNAVLLTTNTNGALLLLWLLDTSELPGRYRVLCPRLLPYLTKLCTHKLGSMTVFKVISQRQEPDASQLLLNAIFNDSSLLEEVLRDQVHGVGLVQKIIALPHLEKRAQMVAQVKEILGHLKISPTSQSYRKLLEGLDETPEEDPEEEGEGVPVEDQSTASVGLEWLQNPQAVAMMANMYAAAMTAAASTMQPEYPQQQQVAVNPPLQQSSPVQAAAEQPRPAADLPDMAQFDQLIKSLLHSGNTNTPTTEPSPKTEEQETEEKQV